MSAKRGIASSAGADGAFPGSHFTGPALGILIVALVGALGWFASESVSAVTGRKLLEPVVASLLLGVLVGNTVGVPDRASPAIGLVSRPVLNVAVALLGATVSADLIMDAGWKLLVLGVAVVLFGIGFGLLAGSAIGLNRKLSALLAAGNSICGNSAIAATAPAIGATRGDVASAISLTSIIGILHIVLLTVIAVNIDADPYQYGVLVGLTVYAVPQVAAAAYPLGPVAVQVAVVVKLTRVLLLGPVVLVMSLAFRRVGGDAPSLWRRARTALPWFVVAFALLAAARSFGVIGDATASLSGDISKLLFTLSMAGIGLEVSFASIRSAVPRVSLVNVSSIVFLSTVAIVGLTLLSVP